MSGLEAIGLVLNILPLLISAAEHYDDVLRPFRRYRKFTPEVKRFADELSSEKVIFQEELRLLLASVTNYDVAEKMVEDRDHPSWKDPKLEMKLSGYLGKSKEACKNVIGIIDEDLNKIEEQSLFFSAVTTESSPPVGSPLKYRKEDTHRDLKAQNDPSTKMAWRQRIGRKLKWSLSQSQIHDKLKDLRRHVKVFQRHTRQIGRVLDKQKSVKQIQRQTLVGEATTEYKFIHELAAELYHALIKACKLHPEHTIHFRLKTVNISSIDRPCIRFQMAFIHHAASDLGPTWVAIEAEYRNPSMGLGFSNSEIPSVSRTTEQIQNHLKRVVETPGSSGQRKKMKQNKDKSVPLAISTSKISIESRSSNISLTSNSSSTSISTLSATCSQNSSKVLAIGTPLPDFCQQQDLCNHISQWSKANSTTTDACIGYLGKGSSASRRVLLPPQVDNQSITPVSLAQLIFSSKNQSQFKRFLYIDSIRLAKQLASAILVFHATPILQESWQSEDIVFYNTVSKTKNRSPSLTNPHLNVQIKDTASQTSVTRDKQIRNLYTYRLGVILLELACQTPLSKLREEEDETNRSSNPTSDFEIASSVSETLSTDMGIPFQKIVQKCLNCDFGAGSDLRDPELQAAFHKDVVCGLEGIEERLNALQIDE